MGLGIALLVLILAICLYAWKNPLGDENFEQEQAEQSKVLNTRELLHRVYINQRIGETQGITFNEYMNRHVAESVAEEGQAKK